MNLNTYIPKSGLPISPGEILLEEFLIPMGMTQTQLADLTGLGTRAINEICKGKRSITPRTAILFSDVFNTSIEVWLNLQRSVDIWLALKEMGRLKEAIKSIPSRVVTHAGTKMKVTAEAKKVSKNSRKISKNKKTARRKPAGTRPATKDKKYA